MDGREEIARKNGMGVIGIEEDCRQKEMDPCSPHAMRHKG